MCFCENSLYFELQKRQTALSVNKLLLFEFSVHKMILSTDLFILLTHLKLANLLLGGSLGKYYYIEPKGFLIHQNEKLHQWT